MDAKDKRIIELETLLQAAFEEIESFKIENAQLKTRIAQLEKNSQNSSKPPSSDIVKPPKQQDRRRRKRKIGTQKGHPQHIRTRLLDSIQAMYRTAKRLLREVRTQPEKMSFGFGTWNYCRSNSDRQFRIFDDNPSFPRRQESSQRGLTPLTSPLPSQG